MSKAAKNQGAKNRAAKRRRNELKRANIRKRGMSTAPAQRSRMGEAHHLNSGARVGADARCHGVNDEGKIDDADVRRYMDVLIERVDLADRWPTVASAKAAAKDAGMSGYSGWKAATLDQHRRDLAEHLAGTNQA